MSRAGGRRRGGVVVVCGPDGAGKTAVARAIVDDLLGRDAVHLHHRPGILPNRGGDGSPVTDPHAERPYPRFVSYLKVLYIYCDYLLGWLTRVLPTIREGRWVVLERGWLDLVVDPRRYRLRSSRLPLVLARALPRPDVGLVLEAPPRVLLSRKQEVPAEELRRQMDEWRQLRPGHLTVRLDAGHALPALVEQVRPVIVARDDARPGYVGLPNPLSPRVFVPRAPRRAAAAALSVAHPSGTPQQVAYLIARGIAQIGGFRLLPRTRDRLVRESRRVDQFLPSGGYLGVARSRRSRHSFVVLILDSDARPVGVAKCAADPAGKRELAWEADAAIELGSRLRPPLYIPRLLAQRDGILLWEPIDWKLRFGPWRPPDIVLRRLGQLFRSGPSAPASGPAHGDFAPWNLLRAPRRWVLVDWASAKYEEAPFYDAFHYLVQSHAFLGRPAERELLAGIRNGHGWVGRSIRAYAAGAGLNPTSASGHFDGYLQRSGEDQGRTAVRCRERLLEAWGDTSRSHRAF